jgi:Brp/Blh family beta-carotene 15,15'-monooxygenase
MRRADFSILHVLWLLPGIAALAWAERQWPQIALWIFVGLTLTLGFAHGAMDVWLLLDDRQRVSIRQFAYYGASTLALAAVLLPFPSIALIILLLLSLWHFGEEAAVLQMEAKLQYLLRIVQGGASVMLPVLLSAQELRGWVMLITPSSGAWVWTVWVAMAGLWLALLVAAIAVVQPWRAKAAEKALQEPQYIAMRTLLFEAAALVLLNLFLSPLLAFALFFGTYHAGMHVWRMQRMQQMQQKGARALPWGWLGITLLITWAALAWLWWQMPSLALAQPSRGEGDWLRWLVVALAAVTLPHMVLVSKARARLFVAG